MSQIGINPKFTKIATSIKMLDDLLSKKSMATCDWIECFNWGHDWSGLIFLEKGAEGGSGKTVSTKDG